MCGIVGYIGPKILSRSFSTPARLEYRGYDSAASPSLRMTARCACARCRQAARPREVIAANPLKALRDRHTRWATTAAHGGKRPPTGTARPAGRDHNGSSKLPRPQSRTPGPGAPFVTQNHTRSWTISSRGDQVHGADLAGHSRAFFPPARDHASYAVRRHSRDLVAARLWPPLVIGLGAGMVRRIRRPAILSHTKDVVFMDDTRLPCSRPRARRFMKADGSRSPRPHATPWTDHARRGLQALHAQGIHEQPGRCATRSWPVLARVTECFSRISDLGRALRRAERASSSVRDLLARGVVGKFLIERRPIPSPSTMPRSTATGTDRQRPSPSHLHQSVRRPRYARRQRKRIQGNRDPARSATCAGSMVT